MRVLINKYAVFANIFKVSSSKRANIVTCTLVRNIAPICGLNLTKLKHFYWSRKVC